MSHFPCLPSPFYLCARVPTTNLWPKNSMVFLCMMFIKTVPVHDTKMDILFPTSQQPVQIYLDSPLHPFFLHVRFASIFNRQCPAPETSPSYNITAASTDIPGFTYASFLSTCSCCFHFQWPVSCTRNIIFTITEWPLTFSHVFGD